ncbi:hypothetical protein [Microbacterium caowuchunii]|nr:hypothetical protein [Microbacterium caowuchunii]
MDPEEETAAGDAACWLAIVCEECGAIHEGAEIPSARTDRP